MAIIKGFYILYTRTRKKIKQTTTKKTPLPKVKTEPQKNHQICDCM